jgi:hypothetical protein
MRDRATGCGQAESLGLSVELAPGGTALSSRSLPSRVDSNAAHARQIDHETALAHSDPGSVVAAAGHRYEQLVGLGNSSPIALAMMVSGRQTGWKITGSVIARSARLTDPNRPAALGRQPYGADQRQPETGEQDV